MQTLTPCPSARDIEDNEHLAEQKALTATASSLGAMNSTTDGFAPLVYTPSE